MTRGVEIIIYIMVSSKFSIVLEGCIHNDTNYLAIFAYFSNDQSVPLTGGNTYITVLLALTLLVDETQLTACYHEETLKYILTVYLKSIENVAGFTGDNVSENNDPFSILGIPLTGCASHRFNLPFQHYLRQHYEHIECIHQIIVKVGSLKNATRLHKCTAHKPLISNGTLCS